MLFLFLKLNPPGKRARPMDTFLMIVIFLLLTIAPPCIMLAPVRPKARRR